MCFRSLVCSTRSLWLFPGSSQSHGPWIRSVVAPCSPCCYSHTQSMSFIRILQLWSEALCSGLSNTHKHLQMSRSYLTCKHQHTSCTSPHLHILSDADVSLLVEVPAAPCLPMMQQFVHVVLPPLQDSVEYPLTQSGPYGRWFHSEFCDFMSVLVAQCQHSVIFDSYLMNTLISLLSELSNSYIRAFRHTCTLAGKAYTTSIYIHMITSDKLI